MPIDPQGEEIFSRVIESIYERHSHTLITMAKGAHELRTIMNHDIDAFADFGEIQESLDEFYMSRIGIRMVRTVMYVDCERAVVSTRQANLHAPLSPLVPCFAPVFH